MVLSFVLPCIITQALQYICQSEDMLPQDPIFKVGHQGKIQLKTH